MWEAEKIPVGSCGGGAGCADGEQVLVDRLLQVGQGRPTGRGLPDPSHHRGHRDPQLLEALGRDLATGLRPLRARTRQRCAGMYRLDLAWLTGRGDVEGGHWGGGHGSFHDLIHTLIISSVVHASLHLPIHGVHTTY